MDLNQIFNSNIWLHYQFYSMDFNITISYLCSFLKKEKKKLILILY